MYLVNQPDPISADLLGPVGSQNLVNDREDNIQDLCKSGPKPFEQ